MLTTLGKYWEVQPPIAQSLRGQALWSKSSYELHDLGQGTDLLASLPSSGKAGLYATCRTVSNKWSSMPVPSCFSVHAGWWCHKNVHIFGAIGGGGEWRACDKIAEAQIEASACPPALKTKERDSNQAVGSLLGSESRPPSGLQGCFLHHDSFPQSTRQVSQPGGKYRTRGRAFSFHKEYGLFCVRRLCPSNSLLPAPKTSFFVPQPSGLKDRALWRGHTGLPFQVLPLTYCQVNVQKSTSYKKLPPTSPGCHVVFCELPSQALTSRVMQMALWGQFKEAVSILGQRPHPAHLSGMQ